MICLVVVVPQFKNWEANFETTLASVRNGRSLNRTSLKIQSDFPVSFQLRNELNVRQIATDVTKVRVPIQFTDHSSLGLVACPGDCAASPAIS